MPVEWSALVRRVFSEEVALGIAIGLLVVGAFIAYLVWRWVHSLFRRSGITDMVEATPFDRSLQRYGTSTGGIIAVLAATLTYLGFVVFAFQISQLIAVEAFWLRLSAFFPNAVIAVLAIIIGLVVGERAKLAIIDRLQSVKLPEATIIPEIVKYSIFFIAGLIALGQLGVVTEALLVLLAAYVFGVVFLGGIAFKDLLAASAAGIYLLLTEPYAIGDEIHVDGKQGIVQEVGVFVTKIENDEEEYIIPNQRIFQSGVIRVRN
jgi:small-conductance mechanosensitive channel